MAEPPGVLRAAITGIQALLTGEPPQLRELRRDLQRHLTFQRRARALGQAMGHICLRR